MGVLHVWFMRKIGALDVKALDVKSSHIAVERGAPA